MKQAELLEQFDAIEVTKPLLTAALCTEIVGNAFLPSLLTAAANGSKEGGLAKMLFPDIGSHSYRIRCHPLPIDQLKKVYLKHAEDIRKISSSLARPGNSERRRLLRP